jgi:PilZ domain
MSIHLLLQYLSTAVNSDIEFKSIQEIECMEQRRQERFGIPEAFVVAPEGVGQLINISPGGLAFKRLNGPDMPEKWELDIVIPTNDFHLEQLPVELVWTKINDQPSFLSISTEIIGVKFGELDRSQKKILNSLFSQSLS